jgi:DNA adenine methylase/adenine-specific DNA-methyltransferase
MELQFRERVRDYNHTVFDNGTTHKVKTGGVFELGSVSADIAYLDPPYAPPSDDADYIKRYHFLEGLSLYWRGADIMEETKTKKLRKRFTPFAYKRTIEAALAETFDQFRHSGAIVLSYSSNAVPSAERIVEILSQFKSHVEVREIAHTYSFGTHVRATRRSVNEYIFIGRD